MYVKIHFKTNQGIKTLSQAEADKLAGINPNHHTADMHNAIKSGNYPSWTMYFQVMKPEQAEKYRWNIFDMTKVWPHADFPLQPVGKLTLNRNVRLLSISVVRVYVLRRFLLTSLQPTNYFQDIEQAAFSPSTMVPGIAPTADPSTLLFCFLYCRIAFR